MRSLKGKNMVDLRKSNRARILEVLFRCGPISRAEISEITGLTPPAITALANELIRDGLLKEAGVEEGKTAVGRKRIKLQLIPDSRVAVGVEIGISHILLGLVDLSGRIISTSTLNLEDKDPGSVIELAVGGIKRIIQELGPGQLIGIGVGATGLVDSETGTVRHSPNLGWKNIPLRRRLEDRLALPVIADNNVRLMAFGENMFFHNQSDIARLALIHVGYGIGCGFTIDGELYYGRAFGAGELGHTIILPGGPPCTCGRKGCLETVASGRAINTLYSQRTGRRDPGYYEGLRQLLAAGDRGEAAAIEVLREAGTYMGIGLTNLISLLAPDLIVLHGPVFESAIYVHWMTEQTGTQAVDGKVVPVKHSQKKDELVILGAGALTIQRILIDDGAPYRMTYGGVR